MAEILIVRNPDIQLTEEEKAAVRISRWSWRTRPETVASILEPVAETGAR